MKKNLCLLYGIAFLQGMVFYSPVAVLYRQTAGLTIFQISVIESISLFLCLVLEIPWGILADKIGYRSTMILCCFFYFISKLVFWKAWSFTDFLLERIFLSISAAGLSGVDTTLLYLSAPSGKSQKVFGIYEGMGTAGLLSASLCFSFFLEDHYREAALLTAAAYGLALFLSLFLKETRQKAGTCRPDRNRKLLKSPPVQRYSFLLFLAGAGLLSETVQNVTVFLNQPKYIACGLDTRVIAFLYVLTQIAGMAGPWSKFFTEKLGVSRFCRLCFLIPAVLCFLLAFTSNALCSALCILGIQGIFSLFLPLQTVLQNREVRGPGRAAALSIQSMFLELVSALMNPVFGRLADRNIDLSFAAGGIFCLSAFLLVRFYTALRRSLPSLKTESRLDSNNH